MRGRPRKPTRIKIYEGNRGKRPLDPGSEPQPPVGEPAMPDWISDEAKGKWAELAPELVRLGVLTTVDGPCLACYCQSWAEYRQATRTLANEGRTYKMSNGCGPLTRWSHSRGRRGGTLREFAALLGLDPASLRPAEDNAAGSGRSRGGVFREGEGRRRTDVKRRSRAGRPDVGGANRAGRTRRRFDT